MLGLVHLKFTVQESAVASVQAAFQALLKDNRQRTAGWLAQQVDKMMNTHHQRHGSAGGRARQILEAFPGQLEATVVYALLVRPQLGEHEIVQEGRTVNGLGEAPGMLQLLA